VFDKLVQVLVFGCGYRRIADATCSASTLQRPGRRAQPGGSSQAGPEALGIPLGVVAAAANRRDDSLLAATLDTLDTLAVVVGLPRAVGDALGRWLRLPDLPADAGLPA
jgi:hypothetical protein